MAALILAAFGLFAVLAHDVGQRTHEIGIRMALGAFVISRMMHALLYGVSPMEPIVYVSIGLMLTGVAFLACWVPARRAMRLDPLEAVRQE